MPAAFLEHLTIVVVNVCSTIVIKRVCGYYNHLVVPSLIRHHVTLGLDPVTPGVMLRSVIYQG